MPTSSRSASGAAASKPTAARKTAAPARKPGSESHTVLPERAPEVSHTTVGRFPILDVGPVVDGGARPAKAVVGEPIAVEAVVTRDGHDALGVWAVLTAPDGRSVTTSLTPTGNGDDRYTGWLRPDAQGLWQLHIEAFTDAYATWRRRATIKIPADIDVELEFAEGAAVLGRVLSALPRGKVREQSRPQSTL